MKVALVQSTPVPPQEGIGVYTASLGAELRRRGHEVVLLTRGRGRTDGEGPGERDASGADGSGPQHLRVRRPTFRPWYPLHVHLHRRPMERALRDEAPDLVHFHSPLPPAADTGRPVVTTFHSPMRLSVRRRSWRERGTLTSRLQAPFSHAVEKRLIRLSQAITTVSASRAKELATYGIPEGSIHVIPSGVDTARFRPARREAGPPRLLYVGRLAPAKGLADLLQAMPEVRRRHPDAVLELVGGGPLEASLRALAARLRLGSSVTFAGVVPHANLQERYHAADLVVLPSHYEGLPTCVVEAMACGLPVVGCDVPGTRDAVVPGITGRLVPVSDPPALAAAMAGLLSDPETRRSMGEAGRRRAQGEHDWRVLAERFLAVYADATTAWAGAGSRRGRSRP
jgi:glycosyltransferase involved in cell wall biosynthesis